MVTLPSSPHPRGKRPYVFRGDYYGDPIPGAIAKNGMVICAVDCAWIFDGLGMPLLRFPTAVRHNRPIVANSHLFPYQYDGARFLAERDYALLADEMGLGKTVQALEAAETRLELCSGAGPAVLILCPAIAKRAWAREIKKWTGHDSEILDGVRVTALPTARYVIANYDILYALRRRNASGALEAREGLTGWKDALAGLRFPIVICDEAHQLRGERSRRRKAVIDVAKHSTAVWMLTGTPMPNRVRDIWSLWDLASGGLVGWFWPWAKAYAGYMKTEYGSTADGLTRAEELQNRLKFWMLGRSKAAVGLQLPEKRREIVSVDVTMPDNLRVGKEEHREYKAMVIEGRLRTTARAKRPAVVEMVKEALNAKQKVVVFTYLREQCEAIAKDVSDSAGSVFMANGDQTPEQRDVFAGAFRDATAPACFVATIDSVGVAISLIGADLVIFADLSYDPSKLLQAEGRAHRIGSQHPVLIRYVIAAGTLDEDVASLVVEKLDTVTQVLGGVADGDDLSVKLRRGEVLTASAVVDKLFARLIGVT